MKLDKNTLKKGVYEAFFHETILRITSVRDTTIPICGKIDEQAAVCTMQSNVQEAILC
jgi:hypothetical protein